ncbi:hypothetical protein [Flagellimonas meridianipacifica]|uniref:DUF4359 domain-containing protein n=1 Tax=Flagellimonas meridianipacifica TaxID=1080225 RepID=A0A2T0MFM7_9FLAO|nr:hypothetical protein [Allomuricauda pacifica]PRX56373.1 hypothetical protein CLV81_0370 [Allomuricauda pacifica]
MNTKTITILAIIAILLTAFITNPTEEKHSDFALKQMIELESKEKGNTFGEGPAYGIAKLLGLVNVDIKNYYLFSISYMHSKKRSKTIYIGFGIFGQVFPIASDQDWKEWEKRK